MKFLFAIMLLVNTVAFADVGLVGRSTSLDAAGVVQAGSLEKFFINVKNESGGALEDGDVVVLDVANDNGYSVTTSTTAGAVPHCVLNQACADDQMCECQTYGYKSNVNFDVTNASATAGELVFISESNAGKVEAEAKGSIAASDVPLGVFYDAAAASGDVEVFIKLR